MNCQILRSTSLTSKCGHPLMAHRLSRHTFTHSTTHKPQRRHTHSIKSMMDPSSSIEQAQVLYDIADLNSANAALISLLLRPVLSLSSLFMIVRIVMTWYPEIDATKLPWSVVYTPTEPLLSATRKVVKPFNGLDVSPIVWVALLSFLSEILTGPQGILSLIERKGI